MPPQGPNQYEFIMNNQQPNGAGPSFLLDPKKKMIALVSFIGGIIVILFILLAIIFGGGGGNQVDLLTVAGYQAELARVSEEGIDTSTDRFVRSELATLQSIMISDLNDTKAYLGTVGVNIEEDESIPSQQDPETDVELQKALERSQYEEKITEIVAELIEEYKTALQESFDFAPEGSNKLVLLEALAENILTYESAPEAGTETE